MNHSAQALTPEVSFYITEMHCSVPPRINPDYPIIDELNASWVREFLPFTDEAAQLRFLRLHTPMWDSMIFPIGSADRLVQTSCVTSLITAIDDMPLGRHAMFHDGEVALLEGHPFAHAAQDIFGKLRQHMPAPVYRRYCQELQAWFESVEEEARLLAAGKVLPLDEFLELRHPNTGLLPSFPVAEFLYDLDLTELLAQDRELQLAIRVTNEHVGLVNDILSHRKEHAIGVTLNAMESLRIAHGHSAQEAADILCQRIREADRARVELCEVLRHRYANRPDAARIGMYLDGLGRICAGNLRWLLESDRYVDSRGNGWDWTRSRLIVLDPEPALALAEN
ncbi:terpene synthase family protein [Pseudomonas chlororaphis]|uniref:Terpene synthase n=1 Tax=Pseudomonas chlororaphis TaxID=587753 RepID=A0AAP9VZQ6_9PSED|nr:terpene synthase family protein [Pseudomonas chlororaphis]AUG41105.1 terpene synthase [Pseudomonas chlororaphis]QNR50719.1 terpene synthase [Pseudomonas chlororaphis]